MDALAVVQSGRARPAPGAGCNEKQPGNDTADTGLNRKAKYQLGQVVDPSRVPALQPSLDRPSAHR